MKLTSPIDSTIFNAIAYILYLIKTPIKHISALYGLLKIRLNRLKTDYKFRVFNKFYLFLRYLGALSPQPEFGLKIQGVTLN